MTSSHDHGDVKRIGHDHDLCGLYDLTVWKQRSLGQVRRGQFHQRTCGVYDGMERGWMKKQRSIWSDGGL
jgi:hypothetical protein